MGEIPECSGRTEKPVPCSGDSGKRGPEVDGRGHPKDDQRKCSGIKHLWRCGTNPLAEDIPDQMMDFLSQMENM